MALDASPISSNPSRKRQLTQTPVSSRALAPHCSHFAALFGILGSESESLSEVFIRVTRFRRRGRRTCAGSRLPRRRDFQPCARLHRAAATGNAGAYSAAVFSLQSQPSPDLQKDWSMIPYRVPLWAGGLAH